MFIHEHVMKRSPALYRAVSGDSIYCPSTEVVCNFIFYSLVATVDVFTNFIHR